MLAACSTGSTLIEVPAPCAGAGVGAGDGVASGRGLILGQAVPVAGACGADVVEVALVSGMAPTGAGPCAAAFLGPDPRAYAFGAELNDLRVPGVLTAVVLGAGIVADPGAVEAQPPVALVEIVLGADLILCTAVSAVVGKAVAEQAGVSHLDEVAASVIPAAGGVVVRSREDEEVRFLRAAEHCGINDPADFLGLRARAASTDVPLL